MLKKIYTLLFLMCFWGLYAIAEDNSQKRVDEKLNNSTLVSYYMETDIPILPAICDTLIARRKKITYPESAIKDSVTGTVIIGFGIDNDNNVVDVKVLKSVRSDLDSVCLGLFENLPKLKMNLPKSEYNIPLKFTFPVRFLLEENK